MEKEQLDIALVAFDPRDETVSARLERFDALVDALAGGQALRPKVSAGASASATTASVPDIIVFPETFCTADDYTSTAALYSDEIIERMQAAAQRAGCAVVASVIVPENGKLFNRLVFARPVDEALFYDKRHPYFGGEAENITPGTTRPVFEWRGWRILPAVCMDLRFPCWSRNFPEQNYDLYLNVANWPVARNIAAEILIKARAIENAAFAVFCNRAGHDRQLEYDGRSYIVNYRGRARSASASVLGTTVTSATLDKAALMRFRDSFPVLMRTDNFNLVQ